MAKQKEKPIHASDYIDQLLELLRLQEIVIYSLEKQCKKLEEELKSKNMLN